MFFFSSRRRHTRYWRDWSSDVCSSDLEPSIGRTCEPSVLGLIEGSQVRPIGVTSKERTRKFPDVRSIAESGFPGYEATAWYGFVVPKGTPKAINEQIRKATLETIKTGVVRERLEAEGADPIGNTPEEFAAMMKAESARWAGIVKEAGVKTGQTASTLP